MHQEGRKLTDIQKTDPGQDSLLSQMSQHHGTGQLEPAAQISHETESHLQH